MGIPMVAGVYLIGKGSYPARQPIVLLTVRPSGSKQIHLPLSNPMFLEISMITNIPCIRGKNNWSQRNVQKLQISLKTVASGNPKMVWTSHFDSIPETAIFISGGSKFYPKIHIDAPPLRLLIDVLQDLGVKINITDAFIISNIAY